MTLPKSERPARFGRRGVRTGPYGYLPGAGRVGALSGGAGGAGGAAGAAAGEEAAGTRLTQHIGWDPLARQVVSWAFGSDGSHGEATWSQEDGTWIARTRSVLPDGTQTSSLNFYTYDGTGRCNWRSIHTHVGGEHAPQVAMTMVRKRPAAASGRTEAK